MPSFLKNTSGGKAISGGALAPRSRRGNATAQVAAYWAGGATGPNATGGIGAPVSTGTGYNYLQFNSSGNLTVTSAGTFEFMVIGSGASGYAGNGYNAFGLGGVGGTITQGTVTLAEGTHAIVIGAGPAAPTYSRANGNPSTGGGFTGAGGAASTSGGFSANGAAGTQVNTFIGGASLFKKGGGGNANTGLGGSGGGGNAAGYATAQSGTANSGGGGGGAGGSGLPDLLPGVGGNGGSGIVYVRWLA